jgi:hypothetical protein
MHGDAPLGAPSPSQGKARLALRQNNPGEMGPYQRRGVSDRLTLMKIDSAMNATAVRLLTSGLS